MSPFVGNRVVRDTGAKYPIFNAPIGYVARGPLVAAVCEAGGMGLLELVSTDFEETVAAVERLKAATDKPFGLHIFIKSLRSRPEREGPILDWVTSGHVRFMTSGGGNPALYSGRLREAGVTLYHQVSTLASALKAEDAGVSGLIVEGGEAGGTRPDHAPHGFALLQAVRERCHLPMVAAGGIVDGRGMAAAFALGAEGVLMGTRFMCAEESLVHANYKQAIVEAETTYKMHFGQPGIMMQAVRNAYSDRVMQGEIDPAGNPYAGPAQMLYREGRTDLAMAGAGETAALINEVLPARQIVEGTVAGFWREVERLAAMLDAAKAAAKTSA